MTKLCFFLLIVVLSVFSNELQLCFEGIDVIPKEDA